MTEDQTPNTGTESAGPAPAGDAPAAGEVSKDERTMGMLCHLLGIFLGFLGPLIIWLIKKDESRFVDDQGKEALNFQITLLIAYVVSWLSIFIFIGCILFPAVAIAALVFSILGAVAANKGEHYRYPLNIRFIK